MANVIENKKYDGTEKWEMYQPYNSMQTQTQAELEKLKITQY